jgi:peptidoglycan hydrolase-like protein with peptidoglycan-binding domain
MRLFQTALLCVAALVAFSGPAVAQSANDVLRLGIGVLEQIIQQSPSANPGLQPQQSQSSATQQSQIRAIQQRLASLGYDPGPVDGLWGSRTASALLQFQQANGLSPSGVIDANTGSVLFSAAARGPSANSAQPAQLIQPSFDCARAGNQAERAICSSAQLATLDRQLSATYQAAISSRPGSADGIRRDQRNWLRQRNQCGSNQACLAAQMQDRINLLSAIAGTVAPSPGTLPSPEAPPVPVSSGFAVAGVSLEPGRALYAIDEPIAIRFAIDEPHRWDKITLAPVGSLDSDFVRQVDTGGRSSGAVLLRNGNFDWAPGNYELRLLREGSHQNVVARAPVLITADTNELLSRQHRPGFLDAVTPLYGHWSGATVCGNSRRAYDFHIAYMRDAVRVAGSISSQQSNNLQVLTAVYRWPSDISPNDTEVPLLFESGTAANMHDISLRFDAQSGSFALSQYGCEQTVLTATTEIAETQDLTGSWHGFVEECRSGDWGIDAAIHQDGSSTIADMIFRHNAGGVSRAIFRLASEPTLQFDPLGVPPLPRALTQGASRGATFQEAFRLIATDSATIEFESDTCSYGRLESAPEGDMATVSRPQTFAGVYSGETECATSGVLQMRLALSEDVTGRLTGLAYYAGEDYLMRGLTVQQLATRIARDDPTRLQTAITGADSVLRPELTPGDFDATMKSDGGLDIAYRRGVCEATALMPLDPSPAVASLGQGSFFGSQRPDDRCEALAEWERQFYREYPNLDYNRTAETRPRLGHFFFDVSFVPVFGQPFPLDQERASIVTSAIRDCARQPFFRDEINLINDLASRLTTHRNTNASGWLSVPALQFHVDNNRRAHAAINAIRVGLPSDGSVDRLVGSLNDLKSEIEDARPFLWPSEFDRYNLWADEQLSDLAYEVSVSDFEAAFGDDSLDVQRRMAITSSIFNLESRHSQYLTDAQAAGLREMVVEGQMAEVATLLDTTLNRFSDAVPSLGSLELFEEAATQASDILGSAVPPVTEEYRARLDEIRSEKLRYLVDERRRVLGTFAPTLDGVSSSSAWHAAFTTDFADYLDQPIVADALGAFSADRRALLSNALSDFEDRLEDGQAANEMLEAFLTMSSDLALPVSLEYELIAAQR